MNLFFKSYSNYLIFFLLITWETGFNCGMAQQRDLDLTPWIQEIKLPSQYQDIPNKSIHLDQNGRLFIGKENGLSVVDGKGSVHLHMNGPVYVTGGASDTLFYTAENDIGYLIAEDNLNFRVLSRKHWIPSSQRSFIPARLITLNNQHFVITDRGLFLISDNRAEHFTFQGAEIHPFQVNHELYLAIDGTGILKWIGHEFQRFVDESQIGGESVLLITREKEQLKILTSGLDWYSVNGSDSILYHPGNAALGKITFIQRLNEELILVNTEENGMVFMDHMGNLVQTLGTKGGLPERDIEQVMVLNNLEIWILAHHSLHKINYPSPLQSLELSNEVTGRILTSLVSTDYILLGTSNGIYRIDRRETPDNRLYLTDLLRNTRESIHLLDASQDRIFAAGSDNLYVIEGDSVEILDQGSFTGMKALDRRSLVASCERGIMRYNRTDEGWIVTPIAPLLNSAHSFVTYNNQVLFLYGNGVYRLTQDLEGAVSIPFHMEELLFRLVLLVQNLYLVGNNQVYRYERNEETFLPLPWDRIAEIVSGADVIKPDPFGTYWVVQHDGKYRSRVTRLADLEEESDASISFPVLQHVGEIISLAVWDSTVFITGKDRVSLLDLRKLLAYEGDVPLRIEQNILDHSNIEFYLGGLEFQSVPEPLFRYKLIPGQEEWSPWDQARAVTFDRLKHGDYRFFAQSCDLYGRLSETGELQFTVKTPVYMTWYAIILYAFLLLFSLFLIRKWRLLSYQRAESRISARMQYKLDDMALEKAKSDKLVAEVLPENTASQLKSQGKSKWDKYERATVLFSDIQGFTQIAEEMNPEALIDELDKFFFHFDSVVEKYQIEKIKTIGDAYMAAGGIPEKNSTNPVEVVLAALEMQSYMQHLKSSKAKIWDLRIGIHTGPVIAGVVGHKKVSYDIWGDTVNTASRMESSGTPGKVNISGITYSMVKDYFICEYRGKLPVKYKGNIDMYYVNGLRPELAVDLKEIPNKRFFTQLQLLRLGDLEDKIFDVTLKELPENLHFHKAEYARKVYDQSFLLCRSEEIEQEDRLLVRTAALMLFTGFTQSYNNFENRSSVISREILPDFKYSEIQIDQICNLILSTKMPFNPNNPLEKILIDAKMEYIGRPDYTTQIKLLHQEMKEFGSKLNGQQFKKQQLELLYNFEYFTVAGQRLREVSAADQMATLEEERWI